MIIRTLPWFGVLALALIPASVGAQTVAQSFGQLWGILKVGEVVVVTDETGRATTGKVAEAAGSSLVILSGSGDKRTFDETTVTKVVRRDALWNGIAIGTGIGLVPAVLVAAACGSDGGHCEGTGYAFLIFGGIGAGAGAGVDALIGGDKVLFVRPLQTRGVTLSPILGRDRRGVLASIRW